VGIRTVGRNIGLTIVSGNPRAVSVTDAYIAPEAPSDGKISIPDRPNKLPLETVLTAVAVALADADAVVAESCDMRRGYIILVLTIWDTRPEKMPAEIKNAKKCHIDVDSWRPLAPRLCSLIR